MSDLQYAINELRKAIDAVTVDNILQTLRITHAAELAATGRAPHMAVAGLNPHAGEGGKMGREEIDVIAPGERDHHPQGAGGAEFQKPLRRHMIEAHRIGSPRQHVVQVPGGAGGNPRQRAPELTARRKGRVYPALCR